MDVSRAASGVGMPDIPETVDAGSKPTYQELMRVLPWGGGKQWYILIRWPHDLNLQ